MARPRLRSRWSRLALVLAASGAVLGPAGWIVTDRLEQRNDFCNACHLETGVPLHREVRRDFDQRPPASLAALHGAREVAGRTDGAFRCIDCHGGASPLGKLRVKALAAKDALVYLTGRFDEPEGMRFPLWDEDCLQCHAFDDRSAPAAGDPAFHDLAEHNVELGVDCVECHLSHEADVAADHHFLAIAHVRTQCARCHPEFEEGA